MKFLLSLIFLFLLSSGCKHEESLPVSQETLIPVLMDVHSAEAAVTHLTGEEKDSVINVYYNQIMEIHQMKREVFDTCVAILRRNPELTEEIYEKIQETLKKKEVETE